MYHLPLIYQVQSTIYNLTNDYDDIINHPHHVSKKHPQMSMMARAAQFAPFAALTGYDAAIDDTKRKVEQEWEVKSEE